jgi:hypothetical protein
MQTLLQNDFSGGMNWRSGSETLAENEFADGRNVRIIDKNRVRQREGYTEYNSTATGSTEAVTAITIFDDVKGNLIPVIQANGHIHSGSSAFPATGNFTTLLLAEGSGAKPAKFDYMWNTLVLCNEVDVPQIWEGTYGVCGGFLKTTDIGVNYTDLTSLVTDEVSSTKAQVGSLDTVANGDWVLVGSRVPALTGIRVEMGSNVNAVVATLALDRLVSGSWTSISVSDGTAAGSAMLAQSGDITFSSVSTDLATYNGMVRYWWRISTNVALSSSVELSAVYLKYGMQALPNLWCGDLVRPSGVKTTVDTSTTITDQTQYATDGSLSTKAFVGGMATTTGAIYIQHPLKFQGIRTTVDRINFNGSASVLTAKYWDGDSWESVTIADGTSAGSATFAQSGSITFTPPATWQKKKLAVDIDSSYQIQLLVGSTLSADVDIAEVEVEEYPDPLVVHKLCLFHKNRLWLANRPGDPNYLFFSAEFLPDVFNGPDAGYVGIPSGEPITAIARFFNELFIATSTEVYILEGYSPETFGLLKINSGGVGCVSHKSCVAVGKYIYFAHSTGFYRFDGLGVILISRKMSPLFDTNDTTNQIPVGRLEYIEGRYHRLYNKIEWSVSKGSGQTTNNMVVVFDVDNECWDAPHDITAASLVQVIGSSDQELLYHGSYTGKVHRDYVGTSDNGTAISSYLTTRNYADSTLPGWEITFSVSSFLLETQASGSLTTQYAVSGNSSFTTYGTGSVSMVGSGKGYVWKRVGHPVFGTMFQLKLSQSTLNISWEIMGIRVNYTPVRSDNVG